MDNQHHRPWNLNIVQNQSNHGLNADKRTIVGSNKNMLNHWSDINTNLIANKNGFDLTKLWTWAHSMHAYTKENWLSTGNTLKQTNVRKRTFSLAFLLWHKSNIYLFTACSRICSDIVCILQLKKSKHSEKKANDVPYKLQPAHYQSFVFALNSLCARFLLAYSSLEDNRLGARIFGFCPCGFAHVPNVLLLRANFLQICSFTLIHCYDMQREPVRKKPNGNAAQE